MSLVHETMTYPATPAVQAEVRAEAPISHSGLILRTGEWLLKASVLFSWIVFFEPAPTDILFFGAFLALASTGQLLVPRSAMLLHLSAFGFLAANVASLLLAKEMTQGLRAMAINIYMLLLLYTFMSLVIRQGTLGYERLGKLFFWATAISAVISLAAYLRLFPGNQIFFRAEQGMRLKGLFKDPNVFGPYLVAGLILGISISLSRVRITWREIAAALVILLIVVLSFSRGAWVNLLAAGTVFAVLIAVLSPFAAHRNLLLLFVIVGLPLAGGVLFVVLDYFDLFDFVRQRSQLQRYDSHRFGNQYEALRIAAQHPMGVGPGHYVGGNHFAKSEFELATHNGFLKVLVENGWLGLAAYLGMFCGFFGVMWRGILRHPELRIYLAGCIAIISGILVNSLVIDSLHWRHLFMVLGMGFGLVIAADRAAEIAGQPTAEPFSEAGE